MRHSRNYSAKADERGRIRDAVSISERPRTLKIARYLGIGKTTCSSTVPIARSSPWSSVRRGS